MPRFLAVLVVALAGLFALAATPAAARTVACSSRHGHYHECATNFRRPVILRQESDRPCIYGESWGFDRGSGILWVDNGCRAVFAEGAVRRYERRYFRDHERGDEDFYLRRRRGERFVYPPDDGGYDDEDCADYGDC